MNKEQTIKKILKLGFKEYTPSSLENYDRAWHKRFKKDKLFINISFWEFSKYPNGKDSFNIEVYRSNNDFTEQIGIYAFDNFNKAYKQAISYIK